MKTLRDVLDELKIPREVIRSRRGYLATEIHLVDNLTDTFDRLNKECRGAPEEKSCESCGWITESGQCLVPNPDHLPEKGDAIVCARHKTWRSWKPRKEKGDD